MATNFNLMIFIALMITTIVISIVAGYKVSIWYPNRNVPKGGVAPVPSSTSCWCCGASLLPSTAVCPYCGKTKV